ncbi:MAG: inorganic diphosphatase [Alphaproteobacteria bacterium]
MRKKAFFIIAAFISTTAFANSPSNPHDLAYPDTSQPALKAQKVDEYTIQNNQHYNNIYPLNDDGTINVVVEIPTGTLAKWEINADNNKQLVWEFKEGRPRVVQYLGYPGNYGTIPRTLLSKERGGDDESLDVLILGQALPRGIIIPVRPIGVLRTIDKGRQDDKIIAVMIKGSPFSKINTMEELDRQFKGVSLIIKTWFNNYKGPHGDIHSIEYGDAKVAFKSLEKSMEDFVSNLSSQPSANP